MKSLLLSRICIFYLLACSYNARAQHGIDVYHAKINVLYSGVENILKIPATDVLVDTFSFTSPHAFMKKEHSGIWLIKPEFLGDCAVYMLSDSVLLDSFFFRVVQVPEPTILVRSRFSHYPVKRANDYDLILGLPNEGFPYDIRYNVISFNLRFSTKEEGYSGVFNISGQYFSDYLKHELKTSALNVTSFELSDILFEYPDGTNGMVKHIIFEF